MLQMDEHMRNELNKHRDRRLNVADRVADCENALAAARRDLSDIDREIKRCQTWLGVQTSVDPRRSAGQTRRGAVAKTERRKIVRNWFIEHPALGYSVSQIAADITVIPRTTIDGVVSDMADRGEIVEISGQRTHRLWKFVGEASVEQATPAATTA